jgi:Zn-dependent peptidase ImmA (M78 family)
MLKINKFFKNLYYNYFNILKNCVIIRLKSNRGVNLTTKTNLQKDKDIIAKYKYKVPVNVNEICEELNIEIVQYDFTKLEEQFKHPISGALVLNAENNSKQIFVNKNDSSQRKRFTIAHELGHYILHQDTDTGFGKGVNVSFRALKNQVEREADNYAANLLMNNESIRKYYDVMVFKLLTEISDNFNVSKQAMAYKLDTLGLYYE